MNELIRQAEKAKGKMYDTPGEAIIHNSVVARPDVALQYDVDLCKNYVHSAMVDEHYLLVGNFIEDTLKEKIMRGEYVDFGKLIARDRIQNEEDFAYKMIIKGGQQFWAPAGGEKSSITGFNKWEQAFRVCSNVYLKAHPNRASELIQYSHLISTISQEYLWSNVYRYDKDFRIHMAAFPNRSWSIILQQAWMIRLKEKLYKAPYEQNGGDPSSSDGSGNRDRTCRRYNKGKCSYGTNCKYEHKCKYCKKWGHSMFSCRKYKADKGGNAGNNGNGDAAMRTNAVEEKVAVQETRRT